MCFLSLTPRSNMFPVADCKRRNCIPGESNFFLVLHSMTLKSIVALIVSGRDVPPAADRCVFLKLSLCHNR